MQPAPAVSFVCDDGGRWRAMRAALPAIAGAAVAAWGTGGLQASPIVSALTAAAVAAVIGGWVWRRLGREPRLSLRWDGAAWHAGPVWSADDTARARVGVTVALDVAGWTLLTLRPGAEHHTEHQDEAGAVATAASQRGRTTVAVRAGQLLRRRARWCAVQGAGSAVRAALHAPAGRPADPPDAGRAGA
jgi:hypothetical protein